MAVDILNKEAIRYGEVITMETIICYKCAIPFAVPSQYKAILRSSQETFYCPNGHNQCYSVSTEATLRQKLDAAEKEKARLKEVADYNIREASSWRDQWEKQLKAKKAVAAKLKKTETRIANGVCPCCNRTFKDLQKHMATKHPEQVKEAKK